MRGPRRQRKVALTGAVTFIFVLATMVPDLAQPAFAAPAPAPPRQAPQLTAVVSGASSAVPEDPLGQQPEQQTPEISVDVDVRDGHLVARVVDVWGPSRAPFVVRSYTNTGALDTSAAGTCYLNRLLDITISRCGAVE